MTSPVLNSSPAAAASGAARPAARPQSEAVPFRTMLLAGLIAWLVAALAFACLLLVLRHSLAEPPMLANAPVMVSIGAVELTVPAAMIRNPAQRSGGALETLELMLDARQLAPVPRAQGILPPLEDLVFLSFEPAREGSDPAGRTEDLYGRFLTDEAEETAGGLIRRRFKAKSPYNDEELYLAPPDGRAFSARCGPLEAKSMAPSCLWQVRHGGLDIRIRFAPVYLKDWQRIAAGSFDLIAAMRSKDGGATTP
jgi:hypothetical protein